MDLYLFLGDYIYEAPSRKDALRGDDIDAVDLATYRAKYALVPQRPGPARAAPRSTRSPTSGTTTRWRTTTRQQPGALAGPALRRLPRRVRVAAADVVPQGPPPDLPPAVVRRAGRRVPDRPAPVPHGQQRRAAAAHARRRADELADLVAEGLDGDVEDHRQRGRHRVHRLRRLAQRRRLGRLRRRTARSCSARSSAPASTTSCSSPATRTCSCAACWRRTSRRSATARARKPAGVEYVDRLGHVASARTSPSRRIQQAAPWNREYNGDDHGYGRLRIGPDQLVTDFMASDIVNPAGGDRAARALHAAGWGRTPSRASRTSHARVCAADGYRRGPPWPRDHAPRCAGRSRASGSPWPSLRSCGSSTRRGTATTTCATRCCGRATCCTATRPTTRRRSRPRRTRCRSRGARSGCRSATAAAR